MADDHRLLNHQGDLFSKYPRICFGCFHQFIMCPNRSDLPFAKDDDQVCPADLRQAVGNNEGCPAAGCIGDGALDPVFGG